MSYTWLELAKHAEVIGCSTRTLRRWIKTGCDLNNPESVKAFEARMNRRRSNAQKVYERRGLSGEEACQGYVSRDPGTGEHHGNGETVEIGKLGAAAALSRLESAELAAHERLPSALSGWK
jgi:hypothetical protein